MYKRQVLAVELLELEELAVGRHAALGADEAHVDAVQGRDCLLYTSDAADERSSVDLGGRRIIKKKQYNTRRRKLLLTHTHSKQYMN